MIQSKKEYREYVDADRSANHIDGGFHKRMLITGRYLKCMRKLEYVLNCYKGLRRTFYGNILKLWLYHLSVKSGITLPPNTFGKGLYLAHHGSIVVNHKARFGNNCVLQNGVNISNDVVGGDHIYLGAGSKVMIGVHLAKDIIVGANAVVTKSFTEENIVLAGIPAVKISNNGFCNRKIV